jgi:hypothetical protein
VAAWAAALRDAHHEEEGVEIEDKGISVRMVSTPGSRHGGAALTAQDVSGSKTPARR